MDSVAYYCKARLKRNIDGNDITAGLSKRDLD